MSATSQYIAQQQNIPRISLRVTLAAVQAKRIHTSPYNDPRLGLFTGILRFSWL